MDTQSRLIEFIHSKKISISDFERISNLSTGYVHKITLCGDKCTKIC